MTGNVGRDLRVKVGCNRGRNFSNEVHPEHSSSNTECSPSLALRGPLKEGQNQWKVKSSVLPNCKCITQIKGDKRSNGPWAVLVPNGVKASTVYGYSHLSYYNVELHHGQDNAVTSGKTEVLETNRVKHEKGTG